MSELPRWPKQPAYIYADTCFPFAAQKVIQWERARADAAMARLRVAAETLQELAQGWWRDEAGKFHLMSETGRMHHAMDVLSLIGDLP